MPRAVLLVGLAGLASFAFMTVVVPTSSAETLEGSAGCEPEVQTGRYVWGVSAGCETLVAGYLAVQVGRELSGTCDPNGENTIIQVGWHNEVSC